MKKIYSILLLMVFPLIYSCEQEQSDVKNADSDSNIGLIYNDAPISINQAVKNADFVFRNIEGETSRKRRVSDVKLLTSTDILSNVSTRSYSSDEEAEALAYIVNYENNDGYAILAATKELPPVIMIGDEGNFSAESFLEFMHQSGVAGSDNDFNSAQEVQYSLIGNSLGMVTPQPLYDEITDTTMILKCMPLVKTKWNQGYPYNLYAVINNEQCLAGCVPVGAAQTLSTLYYRHNFRPNGDIHEDYPIDWTIINEQIFQDSIKYNRSTPGAREVATLIRAIGARINANYGSSSTSGSPIRVKEMYDSIGLRNATIYAASEVPDGKLFDMIVNKNYPVDCTAYGYNYSDDLVGHYFNLDGWLRLQYTIVFSDWVQSGGVYSKKNSYMQRCFDLVHVNFGWGGSSDGYYLAGAFDIRSNEYDDYYEDNDNPNSSIYNFNLYVDYTVYDL